MYGAQHCFAYNSAIKQRSPEQQKETKPAQGGHYETAAGPHGQPDDYAKGEPINGNLKQGRGL
jgi:hypothetical protein